MSRQLKHSRESNLSTLEPAMRSCRLPPSSPSLLEPAIVDVDVGRRNVPERAVPVAGSSNGLK